MTGRLLHLYRSRRTKAGHRVPRNVQGSDSGSSTDDSSLDDSTSSSSSDDDDEEEPSSAVIPSNVERRAHLYKLAVPSATARSLAGERRVNDKLGKALLDARRALLLSHWVELLAAIKVIENYVKVPSNDSRLSWKLPILERLFLDAIAAIDSALPEKRSLAADEAKAIATLKQRLLKDPKVILWSERVDAVTQGTPKALGAATTATSTPVHAAILDSFEVHLLSPAFGRIELSNLGLYDVPKALASIPKLLEWYTLFGELPVGLSDFQSLDLSLNSIKTLPSWLPQCLPGLKALVLVNNPIRLLPPHVTLLQALESLTITTPSTQIKANAMSLLQQAVSKSSPSELGVAAVDSLVTICLRVVGVIPPGENGHDMLLPHWQNQLTGSYSCASCRQRLLRGDPEYLARYLIERVFLLYPAISQDPRQPPVTTSKTAFNVGGEEWRFCASCLRAHLQLQRGCACLICAEEGRVLRQGLPVRWARRALSVV